jgi:hypothetical protein
MEQNKIKVSMKYILLIMILTLSSCFKVDKWIVKHPNHYKQITEKFVMNGGCIQPILVKTDTLYKDSLIIDTFVDEKTIIKGDTIYVYNTINNVKYRTGYITKYIEDTNKVKILNDKLIKTNIDTNYYKHKSNKLEIILCIIGVVIVSFVVIKIKQ